MVPFFVCTSNIWICVMSLVGPDGWLVVLRGKNLNVGHYTQTFEPIVFILTMLIGTIDFYHFISLSLVVLHGKNLNVGHNAQNFEPIVFILTMLIGTIDFYHFISLSLTLTLPGGHKVSTRQNTLASFSGTLIN